MTAGSLLNGIKGCVNGAVAGSSTGYFLVMELQLHMGHCTNLVPGADGIQHIVIGRRNLHGFRRDDCFKFPEGNMIFFLGSLAETFPYFLLIICIQIIPELFRCMHNSFNGIMDAQNIIGILVFFFKTGDNVMFLSGRLTDHTDLACDAADLFHPDFCTDTQ